MTTLEEIKQKLGFDPLNPPKREIKDQWLIDDHTPSPYSVLSDEESHFLYGIIKEIVKNKSKTT